MSSSRRRRRPPGARADQPAPGFQGRVEGVPDKALAKQPSESSVLVTMPSLRSSDSGALSEEAGCSRRCSEDLDAWQPDLAGLCSCLTVSSQQSVDAAKGTGGWVPPPPGMALHVRLEGGSDDLLIFTLVTEPTKHTSTPQPPRPSRRASRLFKRALAELGVPVARGPAAFSTRASLEDAALAGAGEVSSGNGDYSPAAAAPAPAPESRAAASINSLEEPCCMTDPLAGEHASSPDLAGALQPPAQLESIAAFDPTAASALEPALGFGPPAASPPVLPEPIMVFDSVFTLRARMLEWAVEVFAFNAIQSRLHLVTGTEFVPLCPRCPVVQVLLTRAGLFPQVLVSAAARYQELLEADPQLQAAAADAGVWRFAQVAVAGFDGRLQVVGYKPEAMTLLHAPAPLRAAYVGCVFHEANRMDSGPAWSVHTVTVDGILEAPREPKYGLADLQDWLSAALGCPVSREAAAEAAQGAARACCALDRALIVVG